MAEIESFISALGAAGLNIEMITNGLIAAAGEGPAGAVIYLSGLAIGMTAMLWSNEGIAFPSAKWNNPQAIFFDHYQIWTEEGTGNVRVYQYKENAAAKADMASWFCSRIFMKKNVVTGEVDVIEMGGMALARSTIKSVAFRAYHEQLQKNIQNELKERGLESTSITTERVQSYLDNMQ